MNVACLASCIAVSAIPAAKDLPFSWSTQAAGQVKTLTNYSLVFNEEFDRMPTFRGPQVFAPVHAPYGAGQFDPPGQPAYAVEGGALRLTAYLSNGVWRSGSVQTVDAAGAGFKCVNCYFEARIALPATKTSGFWGGFWLLSNNVPAVGHAEIDVIEWYGGDPKGHHQAVHLWRPAPAGHAGKSNYINMANRLLDGQWHTYGAQKEGDAIIIYMDRIEISRVTVSSDFDVPFYPLVSLAVNAPEAPTAQGPMTMRVDYIRAYKPKITGSESVSRRAF